MAAYSLVMGYFWWSVAEEDGRMYKVFKMAYRIIRFVTDCRTAAGIRLPLIAPWAP
jgi:hypothetical protein